MKDFVEFEAMREFPQEVLDKIVLEGEQRLHSQLQVATAADQRALVFAGFQITGMIAAIGGLVALSQQANPDFAILLSGTILLIGLAIGCFFAIKSIEPKVFSFPGNLPENWIVDGWLTNGVNYRTADETIASVEQAYVLNQSINKNQIDMEDNAQKFHNSIKLTFYSVVSSVGFILLVLLLRMYYS